MPGMVVPAGASSIEMTRACLETGVGFWAVLLGAGWLRVLMVVGFLIFFFAGRDIGILLNASASVRRTDEALPRRSASRAEFPANSWPELLTSPL